MKTIKQYLSQIKKNYIGITTKNDNWRSQKEATTFIRRVNGLSLHYAHILGFTQQEVLHYLEEKRDYWSANYYGNMHRLDKGANVLNDMDEFWSRFPSKQYICPACKKIVNNPQECDKCGWKSYGLFGCLSNGYSFITKKEFFDSPRVKTIFKPIELI